MAAAAEFCKVALEACEGAVATAEHPSALAVRWVAAESVGVDPVDLLGVRGGRAVARPERVRDRRRWRRSRRRPKRRM